MNDKALLIGSQMSPGWFDVLILLGAIMLVALITLLWAVLVRKKGAQRRKHRQPRTSYREQFRKNADEIKQLVQPQRRKHSEHRPLNPTLAETGGLPPVREKKETSGQTPPPTPQP